MKPFYRKRGETIVLELTCTDRNDQRQSLSGVTGLAVNVYTKDLQPVTLHQTSIITKLETTDPATFGDVIIQRPDDGLLSTGNEYLFDIEGNFGAIPVKFPERDYIHVIIN